jgi:hypothetical protein
LAKLQPTHPCHLTASLAPVGTAVTLRLDHNAMLFARGVALRVAQGLG